MSSQLDDIAGGARQVFVDALPQRTGCLALSGREVELQKPLAHRRHCRSRSRIVREAQRERLALCILQRAQNELACEHVQVFAVVRAADHPMHSFSAASPRRTQALAVPTGTPSRPAISPWE